MMILLLGLLGLALGSFINALVWRLWLNEEKTNSKKQAQKNSNLSIWKGRSVCPNCKHTLAADDLIPVISWLLLRGKCRYCKKPIPDSPLVELLTSVLFITTYIFWPYQLATVADYFLLFTFYILLIPAVALIVYDLKWMILPSKLVYSFNSLSVVFILILSLAIQRDTAVLLQALIGSIVFSGFFYVLYQVSGGKWIGGGDVRLAVGLGILLGWQKSILALTLAAYVGTVVILVLVILKKYHKKMKLPFGPFLLFALYITFLWGQHVIDWYLRLSGL